MTDKRADNVPDRDFDRLMRQGLRDLADEAPAYVPTRAAYEIPPDRATVVEPRSRCSERPRSSWPSPRWPCGPEPAPRLERRWWT